jgi:hypothetical protein
MKHSGGAPGRCAIGNLGIFKKKPLSLPWLARGGRGCSRLGHLGEEGARQSRRSLSLSSKELVGGGAHRRRSSSKKDLIGGGAR